ncbi:cellulose synthase, partial [Mesorhizobium sp. BR1-1-16]|nr:cellulose synthase [Mesorhizobium sp. BR1-1-16]
GGGCRSTTRTEQLRGMSALTRGWCLLSLNRPIEAVDAFDIALNTNDGKARQDAAYGKTLANLRAGLTDAAAISAAAAPQDTRRAVEMRTEILTQRAIAAYADNRWTEALLYLDERSQIAPEQNDLLIIRAWSYYHLGKPREAKRLFVAAAGTGSRDAAKALAVIANSQQGGTLGDGRDRR